MSRLAVAVIEGEESRIRETVGTEVELKLKEEERGRGGEGGRGNKKGERREWERGAERGKKGTKEQNPQSRGLWTAGQRTARTLGHQNRETLGL